MIEKQQTATGANDPSELARLYADIARKGADLVTQYLEHNQKKGAAPGLTDELGITQAFFQAWAKLLADPFKLAEAQAQLWQNYVSLWQHSMLKLMGQHTAPVAAPLPGTAASSTRTGSRTSSLTTSSSHT